MIWSTSSAPWQPYKPPTPTRKASKRRLLSESAVSLMTCRRQFDLYPDRRIKRNWKCLRWGSPSNSTTKQKVNEGSHKFISENVWIDRCRSIPAKFMEIAVGEKNCWKMVGRPKNLGSLWRFLLDMFCCYRDSQLDGWESLASGRWFEKPYVCSVWLLRNGVTRHHLTRCNDTFCYTLRNGSGCDCFDSFTTNPEWISTDKRSILHSW